MAHDRYNHPWQRVYSLMAYRKRLTQEQAHQKARHYCAYQERSHQEVRDKLYQLGLHKAAVEEVLTQLIGEDCLNEERFALQFAGGKFRMKHWGRQKIRYELKQRKVSEYLIQKALQQIDEGEYEKVLLNLARKKWSSIRGQGITGMVKQHKTAEYLLQRGFEAERVWPVIKQVGHPE